MNEVRGQVRTENRWGQRTLRTETEDEDSLWKLLKREQLKEEEKLKLFFIWTQSSNPNVCNLNIPLVALWSGLFQENLRLVRSDRVPWSYVFFGGGSGSDGSPVLTRRYEAQDHARGPERRRLHQIFSSARSQEQTGFDLQVIDGTAEQNLLLWDVRRARELRDAAQTGENPRPIPCSLFQ